MVKIYQGNLPKTINVVVDRKVIATARFNDFGIYETNNQEIINELKRYGYEVEAEIEKPVIETEPEKEPGPIIEPKAKPKAKAKPTKKKGVK